MAYIGSKPADKVLTASDITDGVVSTAKIATDAITEAKIADDAVLSAHIGAGDFTFPSGSLILGTSGKGIDFSATSDAGGMTSELLDDYEEGTWTPALDSLTQENESGHYTKIGNVCTAKFNISPTGSGSNIYITGFPFTSASGYEQQGWARETESAGNYWAIRIAAGATTGAIIRYDASTSIDTGDTFSGQITYITA